MHELDPFEPRKRVTTNTLLQVPPPFNSNSNKKGVSSPADATSSTTRSPRQHAYNPSVSSPLQLPALVLPPSKAATPPPADTIPRDSTPPPPPPQRPPPPPYDVFADVAAQRLSQRGVKPADLLQLIPRLIKSVDRAALSLKTHQNTVNHLLQEIVLSTRFTQQDCEVEEIYQKLGVHDSHEAHDSHDGDEAQDAATSPHGSPVIEADDGNLEQLDAAHVLVSEPSPLTPTNQSSPPPPPPKQRLTDQDIPAPSTAEAASPLSPHTSPSTDISSASPHPNPASSSSSTSIAIATAKPTHKALVSSSNAVTHLAEFKRTITETRDGVDRLKDMLEAKGKSMTLVEKEMTRMVPVILEEIERMVAERQASIERVQKERVRKEQIILASSIVATVAVIAALVALYLKSPHR